LRRADRAIVAARFVQSGALFLSQDRGGKNQSEFADHDRKSVLDRTPNVFVRMVSHVTCL
jgi:hypothetical protein